MHILLLGSNYLTSSILKRLLYIPGPINITLVDRRDPHYAVNQDVLQAMQALAAQIPDLKKNLEYSQNTFRWNPTDSLSFVFLNPVNDSIALFTELSQQKFDIVVDTAMMNDPLYAENNIMDTVKINCVLPSAIFTILKNIGRPKLYINLSSGIVYGKQLPHKMPFKEDEVIPNPVGARAGSLLARENLIAGLATAMDIPFITLRIGTPIGYYTPFEGVANQIAKYQLLKQPIVVHGDGTQARDFFDIDDLGTVIYNTVCNAMEIPLPDVPVHQKDVNNPKRRITGHTFVERIRGKVFNIGGAKTSKEGPFTIITLDRLMQTALGRVEIPKDLGKITIKNSITKNLPPRDAFEDGLRIQLDIEKAESMLDYDPTYSILDTLKTKVIPYVASNFLNYSDEMIEELKKTMKIIN